MPSFHRSPSLPLVPLPPSLPFTASALFFELFATKNTSYLIRSAVACIRSATASRKKLKSTNEHRQSRKGSIAQLFVTKSQTAQAQMSTLAYARLD